MNRTRVQCLLFLWLLPFLGVSCASAAAGPQATRGPSPASATPGPVSPVPSTATEQPPAPLASPTQPGSFSDFLGFATQIDQALQGRDAAFFADRASPSSWDCLGDETQGICAGRASGLHLEGIPIADEWKTYKLYSPADYRLLWQSAFRRVPSPRLVALASRSGDNPLMPGADQSFQAVLSAARPGAEKVLAPVRVLYFEYVGGAWRLQGELVTAEHAADWLQGNCPDCYDAWSAWPK